MRRSGAVHVTLAEICGWPANEPEAILDRRLERLAELVATGPALDVDELFLVGAAQHEPAGLPTRPARRL